MASFSVIGFYGTKSRSWCDGRDNSGSKSMDGCYDTRVSFANDDVVSGRCFVRESFELTFVSLCLLMLMRIYNKNAFDGGRV